MSGVEPQRRQIRNLRIRKWRLLIAWRPQQTNQRGFDSGEISGSDRSRAEITLLDGPHRCDARLGRSPVQMFR